MINIGIHQWLNLKWSFMEQGFTPKQIMHGYLNGIVNACYQSLDLSNND